MSAVNLEKAQDEVKTWLDYKKVGQGKREKQRNQIEVLIDAVADGTLVLNPDFSFTHKLKFPIGEGAEQLKELKYKGRLIQEEVMTYLKRYKSDDMDGRVQAYILALTKEVSGNIVRLDTEDNSIAQGIAIFFI